MELLIDLPKLFIFLGLCAISTVFLAGAIHIFLIHPLVYKKQASQKGIIMNGIRYDIKNKKIDNTNIL
jgi:hypothetical protein